MYSDTYRKVMNAFERRPRVPGAVRRPIAALVTALTLGGMFVAPSVVLLVPVNLLNPALQQHIPDWLSGVALITALLALPFALVMTIVGAMNFQTTHQLENLVITFGLAFCFTIGLWFFIAFTHHAVINGTTPAVRP